MGMYRDSTLGLCLDLRGPDGNVFALLGLGDDLAQQLGNKEEWKTAVKAAKLMDGNYMTMVHLFQEYFPIVTLIGYEEIRDAHQAQGVVDECVR